MPKGQTQQEIVRLLMDLSRSLTNHYDAKLAELHLTLPQAMLLRQLGDALPMNDAAGASASLPSSPPPPAFRRCRRPSRPLSTACSSEASRQKKERRPPTGASRDERVGLSPSHAGWQWQLRPQAVPRTHWCGRAVSGL